MFRCCGDHYTLLLITLPTYVLMNLCIIMCLMSAESDNYIYTLSGKLLYSQMLLHGLWTKPLGLLAASLVTILEVKLLCLKHDVIYS